MDAANLLKIEIARAGLVTRTGRVNLREASRAMGVPYATLQSWTSGFRSPSADALEAALNRLHRQLIATDLQPARETSSSLDGQRSA